MGKDGTPRSHEAEASPEAAWEQAQFGRENFHNGTYNTRYLVRVTSSRKSKATAYGYIETGQIADPDFYVPLISEKPPTHLANIEDISGIHPSDIREILSHGNKRSLRLKAYETAGIDALKALQLPPTPVQARFRVGQWLPNHRPERAMLLKFSENEGFSLPRGSKPKHMIELANVVQEDLRLLLTPVPVQETLEALYRELKI
jgi:hypothetical protein